MSSDSPIVEEVRRRRMEMSAEFDHDLKKFCAHLRQLQDKHKDRLVSQVTVVPSPQEADSRRP